YAFVGVALGRANVVRTAGVSGTVNDSYTVPTVCGIDGTGAPIICDTPVTDTRALNLPGPLTDSKNGVFAAGYAAGLGLDVELFPNLFFRAEWEYISFAPIKDIRATASSARAGLGFKF